MAKRYKVNRGIRVNTHCSKTGIKWEYGGKVDEWEEVVDDFIKRARPYAKTTLCVGIRITDTETGEIVCEEFV